MSKAIDKRLAVLEARQPDERTAAQMTDAELLAIIGLDEATDEQLEVIANGGDDGNAN